MLNSRFIGWADGEKTVSQSKLMIIGFGRIGKKFAEIFADGFEVRVSSRRDVRKDVNCVGAHYVEDFGETVGSSDYIFLAVPIHALDSVIEQVNRWAQPGTWAFDMCSARVAAAERMSTVKCRWFGLHAGGVFRKAPDEIIDYLAQKGHRFRPMAPEEHDLRNSVVAMVHFIGMATESILSQEDRRILTMSSPTAGHLLRLIEHLRKNSPDTYWESQLCNPFTRGQRQRLLKGLAEYAEALDRGEFPFAERLSGIEYNEAQPSAALDGDSTPLHPRQ